MASSIGAIVLTFVVPVVCTLENGEPKCNLELVRVNESTWVDAARGFTVTVENGILTVITND